MGVNHVNLSNGETVIDLRGDTVGIYDLYDGKTAHGANGEPITGAYKCVGMLGSDQWSANSTNCSSSQLIIPCDFEPSAICIILNSATFINNKIFSIWAYRGIVQYLIMNSSGKPVRYVVSGDYYSYDSTNKRLIFKQYSSTYNWSTNNYKGFLFR